VFHVKQSRAEALAHYRALIARYGQALDLVSPAGLAQLDVLLAQAEQFAAFLLPRLSPTDRLLDLGSGVGLPGVVLTLSAPWLPVALVERRHKRAAFLRLVVAELGLSRATVLPVDARALKPPPTYSVISGQAVGSLLAMYCLTRQVHANEVLLAARKGRSWQAELAELEASSLTPQRIDHARDAHGTLIAVRLAGGLPCRSSASSTRKVGSERRRAP
jgi:16S rRNA (guanine527-N7)-methyltransferase